PGLIDTERGATAGKVSHRHGTLLGRKGKPEEVAAVVRLLAGPDGRFVTGQEWHVNGGAYLG
ncbi:MAG TPA: SDR family oxidoreductase, partial [Usitatibacter sp.]|nr:SDR family oxidoreductase [Usitatibacter sp.]